MRKRRQKSAGLLVIPAIWGHASGETVIAELSTRKTNEKLVIRREKAASVLVNTEKQGVGGEINADCTKQKNITSANVETGGGRVRRRRVGCPTGLGHPKGVVPIRRKRKLLTLLAGIQMPSKQQSISWRH